MTKFLGESDILKVTWKGQLASLQTAWMSPVPADWQNNMHPSFFVAAHGKRKGKKKHKGEDVGRIWAPPPSSLFNQRRKTDMSNHNKTSAGKWAFAITVNQPPLERPPFLDINQCFMDWFLHSLFNYSYFNIYLTTEDFFVRLNHFFVGNHIFTSCLCQVFFFLSFYHFFGYNFVPRLWMKAEQERQHNSYHHLLQLVAAQSRVVKAECHTFDQLQKWSAFRSPLSNSSAFQRTHIKKKKKTHP